MAEEADERTITGGCLCGAVRYRAQGPFRDIIACHCEMCRRTHGHYATYSSVPRERLTLTEDSGLKWYDSSDTARRGFCTGCGASLFFDPLGSGRMSFAAGSIDRPSGLTISHHIYVADAGDYSEIADDLPRFAQSSRSARPTVG